MYNAAGAGWELRCVHIGQDCAYLDARYPEFKVDQEATWTQVSGRCMASELVTFWQCIGSFLR